MDQNDDEPPPFWLQTTTTFNHLNQHRHRRRNHRNPASVFLNTGVLVTFLLVAAILFMFILIPYVLSLARQVLNPNLVKSSWSSLNIVLVLFAILCGFLSRREDDQITPVTTPKTAKSDVYSDQDRVGFTGLRRSSNSYPDLRQESKWFLGKESSKWRSYDDSDVENFHFSRSDSGFSQPRSFKKSDNLDDEIKNVVEVNDKDDVLDESKSDSPSPSVVDEDENKDGDELVEISTNVEEIVNDEIEDESSSKNVDSVDEVKVELSQDTIQSQTPPESPLMKLFPPPSPTSYFWPSPSPPPPPPPPPPSRRVQSTILPKKEANQTFETIGYGRYKWNNNNTKSSNAELPPQSSTSISTPRPRSKPTVAAHYTENKQQSSERKKGGVAVTKDFFTSFYNQSKKKRKHKRRSYENLEEFIEPVPKVSIHRSKSTPEFPPPSPPPPPPPPPPPQTQPQPQHSVFNTLFSKKGKTKKKIHSISTNSTPPTPPPPPKKHVKKTVSKNIAVQGDESPLRPIPTPPPPPPFKLKPWQFVMQGDYVKIESNSNSPRSGYSASEDECSSISPGSVKKSEIPKTPPFCPPSPDVNTKADDFIAMFRAKLTLEKSDSISLKHGNAGPSRFNLES